MWKFSFLNCWHTDIISVLKLSKDAEEMSFLPLTTLGGEHDLHLITYHSNQQPSEGSSYAAHGGGGKCLFCFFLLKTKIP